MSPDVYDRRRSGRVPTRLDGRQTEISVVRLCRIREKITALVAVVDTSAVITGVLACCATSSVMSHAMNSIMIGQV